MEKIDRAFYSDKAMVFKALSHPTRLLIVDMLKDGEKCVCEMMPDIDADTSTVSKHLSILRNAGILKSEKRGQMVYYRLKMECVLGFFSCIRNALADEARSRLAAASDA